MKLINNIILFFKKLFNKTDNVKMIEEPKEEVKENNKSNFVDSLKINMEKKHNKKKIETLKCVGDGLGIQPKLTF